MDNLKSHPPAWSTKFLKWFCKDDYYEDIQGDLEEEFRILSGGSPSMRARSWYNWQIVRLFRPSMMKKPKTQDSIEKETTMFKSYLKIGFRNLLKYRSSTVINVIGLSTGLAAFVMIALFVIDEFSYDRNHEHAESIYRVTVKNYTSEGTLSRHWAFASAGHARRLKEDYSDVTHATRFFPWAFPDLQYKEQKFPAEPVIFADDDVFDIFSFKFIIGDPKTALNDLYSLILTEETAIKIFGNDWKDQDILGETITLSRSGQSASFKVTGVMEDMPDQQHFHFDYLAPIRFVEMIMGEQAANNVGGNYNWMTFVRMSPNTDIPKFTDQVNDEFWDKYIGTFRSGAEARDFYDFSFQPLLDIHLRSNLEGEYETNGSIQQVYIFSIVGILLLLVACVNYMNLATSHYSRRTKEVGVRKVVGAYKRSLVNQFLTESTLVAVISFPLAILFIYLGLPYINEFVDKNLVFNPIAQLDLLIGLIVLLIMVGFVAGLYPAFFLSKMNLVQALKGEQVINASKWNFRSWLVTFQYVVTIALIFSILVIEKQMKYIQNTNPGYQKEQILFLGLSRNINNLDVFKREMLNHPNVESAAYSSRIPTGRLADSAGSAFFKGDSLVPSNFRLPMVGADEDFLKVYEIPLIAGENFTREQDMDSDSVGYYIINRAAAEAFGFNDPNDIVGRRLSYGRYNGQTNQTGQTYRIGRILGVMENFHFESMHSQIVPMVLLKRDGFRNVISLKIRPSDIQSTLKHVEETWAQFDAENPVNYRFVDERFNDQYQQEQRLSTMIKVFTVIAIVIGCLGLIGMVGFVIETRIKEIGIRKVLGASTQNIWLLVSNRFLILIVIAFVISLPMTYWLMDGWLENFVYRTNISVMVIVAPVILAAVLTLLAISYQTFRASIVNPVECLKDE